jgi:predicted permease
VPRLAELSVDWHVIALTILIAVTVAGAFALAAAAQHRSPSGLGALGEGGRSSTVGIERLRLRGALVVTQVALALMLVVGSGLLFQSFRRLRAVDPGIRPDGVLTLQWFLPYKRYDSTAKIMHFDDAVLAKIRAMPGVTGAGLAEEVPLMDNFGCTVQGFEDASVADRLKEIHETTCAGQGIASPGFFEALGMPLVKGRFLTQQDIDVPETGAVVVTNAFAKRFWGDQDPIGKGVGPNGNGKPPFYHVVGVTGDVHGIALDGPPAVGIWYPMVPRPDAGRWYRTPNFSNLIVRTTRANPMSLLPEIRRAVNDVDPGIPLANAELMRTIVDRSMGRLTFTTMLLAIAGLVALALAAIGLYGLISYLVVRRTNEIGVRIALGAQTRQVEALVVSGAMRLTAVGVVIGVLAAAASAKVLGGLLYGVAPWDPAAYVVATVVLAGVAALAGWIPARRAARVDPAIALRAE